MFTHAITVRLHDTDAAGVIYFARLLRMAHEVFEAFLESKGGHLGQLIASSDFVLPIVHAEADYKAPMMAGDRLTVSLEAPRVGTTSFTSSYRFMKDGEILAGTAELVHVAVDRRTGKSVELSDLLRETLRDITPTP